MTKIVSGRDGLQVDGEIRNYGAPVPEGRDWPNLKVWLDARMVLEVPDDWEPPKPPAPYGYLECPWPFGFGPDPGIDELSGKALQFGPADDAGPGALPGSPPREGDGSETGVGGLTTPQNASEGHSPENADGTGNAPTAPDADLPPDPKPADGDQPQAGGSVLATVAARPQGSDRTKKTTTNPK